MRSVFFFVLLLGAYLLLAGHPDGWNVWVRSFLAVVFLATGLEIWRRNKQSKAGKMQALRKPVVLDYLAGLVVIVLLVLCVTWSSIAVSESKILEAVRVSGVSEPETDETSEVGEGGDQLWDGGMTRELAKSSDHKLRSTAEVYLKLLDEDGQTQRGQKRVYLRGFSFSSFDGEKWQAAGRFKKVLQADEQIDFAEVESEVPVYRQRITVKSRANGQNLMLAMPRVKNVQLEQVAQVSDGIFLLPVTEEGVFSYTVESQPLDDLELLEMERAFSVGDPGAQYVSLPAEYQDSQKLAQLISGVSADSSVAERLEFVRELLRERCVYSLKVENTKDLGSMENFLFEEKVGYCEHFASAAAILCRKLGIPSRMAYGYAGGMFYESAGVTVFRARDAHAWTEVFVQGYGWVIFDTTPSSETRAESANSSEALPSLEEQSEASSEGEQETRWGAWWLIGSVLFLSAFGGAISFWKVHQIGVISDQKQVKEAAYFTTFQGACVELGVQNVESKTLKELTLIVKENGVWEPFLDDLVAYHNGVVYRGLARDLQLEKQLQKLLVEWRGRAV